LREAEGFAHVPVVVLTSSDSPRDRLLASELGADCYVRKPSSLDQFLGLGELFKNLLFSTESKDALGKAERDRDEAGTCDGNA